MSFSIMPPRRRNATILSPPKKRQKVESKIEEITFNLGEREDYLAGFHKRKVQRQKQAQAEATKREREEKLAARKILRESRKADLRKHVEAVNAVFKNDDGLESAESQDDHSEREVEESMEAESPRVHHQEEYVDENKFTTVTIEAVDVSRDGLRRVFDVPQEPLEDEDVSTREPRDDTARTNSTGKQSITERRLKHAKQKPKKKRFKYESKADRKLARFKERGKGKRQARERKGK